MSEVVVHAERLSKAFGRAMVLRELTLDVAAGESVAILGPNGAGKSTWLRLCATLMSPTSGTLRLFGADASRATRRRIGLIAHQSFLYPDLTARENLLFYARMYGIEPGEPVVDDWLERVALTEERHRPVRLFARGMEQRLALARALLHEPDLVLLDEPWSGLDAASADWLDAVLGDLRRRRRTILAATHDFQRGLAAADRVLILHRGRLAWDKPVDGVALGTVDAEYRRITGAVAA